MDGAFPWGWSPFGFWLSDQTAIVKDWLLLRMGVGTRAKIRLLLAALCGVLAMVCHRLGGGTQN